MWANMRDKKVVVALALRDCLKGICRPVLANKTKSLLFLTSCTLFGPVVQLALNKHENFRREKVENWCE